MRICDLTFPAPAANLACDEALLDWGEESGVEVLRLWQPGPPCFVVVGYANRVSVEVNQRACAEAGVGIYRRCSGGGTVLQGPGCLNYSLILQIPATGPLATIAGTNHWIMERHCAMVEGFLTERRAGFQPAQTGIASQQAMLKVDGRAAHPEPQGPRPPPHPALSMSLPGRRHPLTLPSPPRGERVGAVEVRGHTDLALAGRKFSGNAQRRQRRALLFHGTFLLSFDMPLVEKFLHFPSRQPEYRQGRRHEQFMVNLPLSPARLKDGLRQLWRAETPLTDWPEERVQRLAAEKYETAAWNLRT
jgi:lipoate-protein ligase A